MPHLELNFHYEFVLNRPIHPPSRRHQGPFTIFSEPAPALPVPNPSVPAPVLPIVLPTHYEDQSDTVGAPRFRKLTFLTFDGKSNPLGWLNKCEHFFRAQCTPENDKVWLASFHMTDVAQEWYYMLERDVGDVTAISWPQFKMLCQQCFGLALDTNHLLDLA